MVLISIYRMVFKSILFITMTLISFDLLAQARNPEKKIIRSDFQKYFDECHVNGTVALYDNNKGAWILSDTSDTQVATLPASTFKIINMLIALETKTIKDENSISMARINRYLKI